MRIIFNVGRQSAVPGGRSILKRIEMFSNTLSAVDGPERPLFGPSTTVMTPENVEAERQSFLQSQQYSTKKHAIAFRISAQTVERILHLGLKLQLYKIVVVHLFLHNFQNRFFIVEDYKKSFYYTVIK